MIVRSQRQPVAAEATFYEEIQSLNTASSVPQLWRLLKEALAREVPHHSLSLYLDYFGSDRGFRVLHEQRVPGNVVPWPERRRLSPAPAFLRQHPGIKTYRLRQILPDGTALRDSDYFRQVMRVEGWDTLLGLGFWEDARLVALLVLRRSAEQGEFAPEDICVLERWHPHLASALARIQSKDDESVLRSCLLSCLEAMSTGVMIFDWDLRLRFMNTAAARGSAALKALSPPDRTLSSGCGPDVPNLVTQALRATKARSFAEGSEPNVSTHRGWTVRVQTFSPDGVGLARPCLLVHLFSTEDGASLRRTEAAARLACLTRCERDVAMLAAAGHSNGEIAARLGKSERTVAAQMGAVLGKLGLVSRVMLARLVAAAD